MEAITARIIIMDDGKIIAVGTKEELKQKMNDEITYSFQVNNLNKLSDRLFNLIDGITKVKISEYVITSVLAGCFYSFTGSNKVLDTLCSIFPQKEYMTLIQGVENGKAMLEFKGQLAYLIIWIVGLWLLGSVISKSKMKKGIY